MYSKLKSSVNTREGLSDYFKCNIGTKQGCVSSPIIFILFINDLISYLKVTCGSGIFVSDEIEELHGLMCADDVSANVLRDFCDATGMTINVDESKIAVFRNGDSVKANEHWFYRNNPIEVL